MEVTKEALEARRQELIQMINQLEANLEEGHKKALMCRGALEQVDQGLATLAMPESKADEEAAENDGPELAIAGARDDTPPS